MNPTSTALTIPKVSTTKALSLSSGLLLLSDIHPSSLVAGLIPGHGHSCGKQK
jgi:hypothetical protein